MLKMKGLVVTSVCAVVCGLSLFVAWGAGGWTLIGWNDLGMHCMDADYSVFSILPPYNTIHAQLLNEEGVLITDPDALGISISFEATADPSSSINASSVGKTNFWDHSGDLFGASPAPDHGLKDASMPGPANTPQPMVFDATHGWFTAEAIPITPYDDSFRKNYYPLMRLVARNAANQVLASTDIVLPVSDEMDCSACHGSGTEVAARPDQGWINSPSPVRDYRLNILRLHDDRHLGDPSYADALAQAGHDPEGLYVTVTQRGRAVLCASCHASNALPGYGVDGIPPFTQALHSLHANVNDPTNGMRLDDTSNRSACYRCHPGSTTRCLRGAMGAAVRQDGSLDMQCQSCHGNMSQVGATTRSGWFDEPKCQSCHTGDAQSNNGQIRYSDVFESMGVPRQAVNPRFATNPDTPEPGLSLYRFSKGHGALHCEACHGSTHAIFPSSHGNDNIQNEVLQGHGGTLVECTACHASDPDTWTGGPHGMHPVGQVWVDRHPDAVEAGGAAQCQACHGMDFRATVLSESKANRMLSTRYGTKNFWNGFRISCYSCHNGPNNEDPNPNHPALAQNALSATAFETPVDIPLAASDNDGDSLVLRVVDQPGHGRVALAGTLATYYPDRGFAGDDSFSWAAWDGDTDSNLASVSLSVSGPLAPSPVPGGVGVSGSQVQLSKLPVDSLRVNWDVSSCPSPGYHLVWYDLWSIGAYTIDTVDCVLGTLGDQVVVPPGGSVAAIVVSNDGASVEGSHGLDSAATERPSAAESCGMLEKNADGTCP